MPTRKISQVLSPCIPGEASRPLRVGLRSRVSSLEVEGEGGRGGRRRGWKTRGGVEGNRGEGVGEEGNGDRWKDGGRDEEKKRWRGGVIKGMGEWKGR